MKIIQIKTNQELANQLEANQELKNTISKFFINPNQNGLNLEKLKHYQSRGGNSIFSIRVNEKSRIFLTFVGGVAYILDIDENHKYDLKKAIRNLEEIEAGNVQNWQEGITPVKGLPAENSFEVPAEDCANFTYYNSSFLTLSTPQNELIETHKLPLIIEGVAGSGKTLVAQELLISKALKGEKVLYFAPTEKLAEMMHQSIKEILGEENEAFKNIQITTYSEHLEKLRKDQKDQRGMVGFSEFETWYQGKIVSQKKGSKKIELKAQQAYQEMARAIAYGREKYIKPGLKSLLPDDLREQFFDNFCQKYLEKITEENHFDPSLQEVVSEQEYDFVVADEFQSISPVIMKSIIKNAKNNNIVFLGDSNQNMLIAVSPTVFIKSQFFDLNTNQSFVNETRWLYSHRCPAQIIAFSAQILGLKDAQYKSGGSLAGDLNQQTKGNENLVVRFNENDSQDKEELSKLKPNISSPQTIVIVPDENSRQSAKKDFPNLLVFTPEEFLGMEAPKIILYGFFGSLPEASANQTAEYAVKINRFFVAATRAKSQVIVYEKLALEKLQRKLGEKTFNQFFPAEKQGQTVLEEENFSYEEWKKNIIQLMKNADLANKLELQKQFKEIIGKALTKYQSDVALELGEQVINAENLFNKFKQDAGLQEKILESTNSKKPQPPIDNKSKKSSSASTSSSTKSSATPTNRPAAGNLLHTQLINALEKEEENIVKELIRKEADVNFVDDGGNTLLINFIILKKYNVVKILLNNGANPNIKNSRSGDTALMFAIICEEFDKSDMVELLLDSGAALDEQRKDGQTALMIAVIKRKLKVINLLIARKVNLNISTEDGATAVIYAIKTEQLNIAELLLENGASQMIKSDGKYYSVYYIFPELAKYKKGSLKNAVVKTAAQQSSDIAKPKQDNNIYQTEDVVRALKSLEFNEDEIIFSLEYGAFQKQEIVNEDTLNLALKNCQNLEEGKAMVIVFKVNAGDGNFSENQNQNNHFVGLHIKKENNQFIVHYIDPTGRAPSGQVTNIIAENFPDGKMESSTHKLQNYDEVAVHGTNCGPFLAYLLYRFHGEKLESKVELTEQNSDKFGMFLRKNFGKEERIGEDVEKLLNGILSKFYIQDQSPIKEIPSLPIVPKSDVEKPSAPPPLAFGKGGEGIGSNN